MKKLSLTFRILAMVLLVISFLLLFVEYDTTYETETWGSKGTLYSHVGKTVLDTDYDYSYNNYFGRIEQLNFIGFDATLEIVLLFVFAISFVVLLVSFFVDFFKNFYFAIFLLAITVLCIFIMVDNDVRYVIYCDYIGSASGYNIYEEATVKFHLSMVPVMISSFLSTVAMLISGIMHLANKKRDI